MCGAGPAEARSKGNFTRGADPASPDMAKPYIIAENGNHLQLEVKFEAANLGY